MADNSVNQYNISPSQGYTYQELYNPYQMPYDNDEVVVDVTEQVPLVLTTPPPPSYKEAVEDVHKLCKEREHELNKEIVGLKRQSICAFALGIVITLSFGLIVFITYNLFMK